MDEKKKVRRKVTPRPKESQGEVPELVLAEEMPVLALRGLVLFPNMILHFDVGREKSVLALNEAINSNRKIFLVAQQDLSADDPGQEELYQVGVVAEALERECVYGVFRPHSGALMRAAKDLFSQYCDLIPKMPRELVLNVMDSEDPLYLSEYIASNIQLDYEEKQQILEETSVMKRMERIVRLLEEENEILSLEQNIQEKVREQVDKNQREYYLREQMKIISEELGEAESPYEELDLYRQRILALHLPAESEGKLLKELDKLSKMPGSSQEGAVIRTYLDTVLDLPWNICTLRPCQGEGAGAGIPGGTQTFAGD